LLCWDLPSEWRASKSGITLWVIRSCPLSSADCCERQRCVAAIFAVRDAPAHDEPRSGPNNSGRESTSGRSTKYASAHLIRAFRNIGRISSLLFLLSHPSTVGHPPRPRVQKRKTQYGFGEGQNGFNCVSCGTHRRFAQNENPARVLSPDVTRAGSREPSVKCRMNCCYEGSAWKTHGRGRGSQMGQRGASPLRSSSTSTARYGETGAASESYCSLNDRGRTEREFGSTAIPAGAMVSGLNVESQGAIPTSNGSGSKQLLT
jgi:hypothetical protein